VWRRARPCESHTHESYDPNEPCDSYKSYESYESNEPCDLNESDESDESDESPAVDREGVFHEVVHLRRRGRALAW